MVAYAGLVMLDRDSSPITPAQFKWWVWIPLGMCDLVSARMWLLIRKPLAVDRRCACPASGLCTNALRRRT
jgi:hypothetical protein